MVYSTPTQLVRKLLEGPVTRPALMQWRLRQFLSPEGFATHFGLFGSFAEARKFLPPSPEFDEEALTEEYASVRTKKIFAYDYPVLWWLSSAFRSGANSILDIGGSVGVHFHAYKKWLQFPQDLSWTVVEVPKVVQVGRRLAQVQAAQALRFSSDLSGTVARSVSNVWIVAGALQYLEHPSFADLLCQCRKRPQHLLLNKLPLYDGDDFVTTQNLGQSCFAPVHIFNRARFIESILAEGYILADEWAVCERSFYLPGHEERSFPCFTGLYFTAKP